VYIEADETADSRTWCNGTLIKYRHKFFVCTTAHALVEPMDMRSLKKNISLLLDPASSNAMRLEWSRCFHSYHRMTSKSAQSLDDANAYSLVQHEPDRKYDVLMFEIEDSVDAAAKAKLGGRARKLWKATGSQRPHDTATAKMLLRNPIEKGSGFYAENPRFTITGRFSDPSMGLATIDGLTAFHGASGAGIIDRDHLLQGCCASVVGITAGVDSAASRTVIILASQFRLLFKAAHADPPEAIIIHAAAAAAAAATLGEQDAEAHSEGGAAASKKRGRKEEQQTATAAAASGGAEGYEAVQKKAKKEAKKASQQT
jgi:hypothetical protein